MDYKVGLLAHIGLLTATLFIMAYSLVGDWGVFSTSLFIIVAGIQLIFLVKYAESSFKKVRLFLNNIKHTALLHSTAATSLDVAVASVAIALLPIDGRACHPPQ